MAANTQLTRITGIKATTVGMLQGTFFGLIGLVMAISYSISAAFEFADSTESVLHGLSLGFAHGIVAIIFVPLIYFAVGWLMGLFYGWILNTVLESSGGIVVKTRQDKE